MRFTLTIDTDNAAFDGSINLEVARILRNVAATLNEDAGGGATQQTGDPIALFDVNGNRVGQATWTHLPRTEGGQEVTNYVRVSKHLDVHGSQISDVIGLGILAHDQEIDIVLGGCVVAQIAVKRTNDGDTPQYTIYERSLDDSRDELVWVGGA